MRILSLTFFALLLLATTAGRFTTVVNGDSSNGNGDVNENNNSTTEVCQITTVRVELISMTDITDTEELQTSPDFDPNHYDYNYTVSGSHTGNATLAVTCGVNVANTTVDIRINGAEYDQLTGVGLIKYGRFTVDLSVNVCLHIEVIVSSNGCRESTYTLTCAEHSGGGEGSSTGGGEHLFSSSTGEADIVTESSSTGVIVETSTGGSETSTGEHGSTGTENSGGGSSTGTHTPTCSTVINTACELTNLQLGSGLTFTPAFNPAVASYSCACGSTTFLSTVTATAAQDNDTLTLDVNGVTSVIHSGQESASYTLKPGANTVSITVDGDNACTNTYQLSCARPMTNTSSTLYNWAVGAFGECVATCTGTVTTAEGTRTRDVKCQDSTGTVVDDSFCTDTKPQTTMSCTKICQESNKLCQGNSCTVSGSGSYNAATNTQQSSLLLIVTAFGAVMFTQLI